jgi:FkbM family methyltransferase
VRLVRLLGAASSAARGARLETLAHGLRDLADRPLVAAGRPPLRTRAGGVEIHGFLRHRSHLADVTRPGTTYAGLFVRMLRPGTTVVDAGAHVGLYTLLAAHRTGGVPVLALEPDPYNLAALRENVRRAGAANVRIVPKALGERRRQATLFRSRGTIGSSLTRREASDVPIGVEVTSLDDELRGLELGALVVKLNIEGAEPLALAGMEETLARCSDATLFVELNPLVLDRPELLVGTLEELGFAVWWIDRLRRSLSAVDSSQRLGKGHLLARRSWSTRR